MNQTPEWANWIARDKDESLYIYSNKPIKGSMFERWAASGDYTLLKTEGSDSFEDVKWEDENPTQIGVPPSYENDLVSRPNHYIGVNGLEVETVLQNFLPKIKDPYVAHRVASAIEYLLRAPEKNGMQDYQKAGKNIEQIERYCKGKETTSDIKTYYGGTNPND